jgi:hypothetical protein
VSKSSAEDNSEGDKENENNKNKGGRLWVVLDLAVLSCAVVLVCDEWGRLKTAWTLCSKARSDFGGN